MHLDKLEIKGFKSFRDRTLLEFPDNFTTIVGPNGSGKSNITEALCFVLGKSRGLRANSMQELIYNGGVSDIPAKEAIVNAYFTDPDNKQFKISREIDLEGNSVYKLDGKRVGREKIVDLLGDNEYNIILQDDVTKVIELNPKERRRYLDDLCGIAEYDRKKEKAIKELEKVEKRISDTHIVLGEKQGYLAELKKERDDAISYRELDMTLKKAKATKLHMRIKDLEKTHERLAKKIEKLGEERKQVLTEITKNKSEITEINENLKRVNSEILKLEMEKGTRVAELRGELNRFRDNAERLKGDIAGIETRIDEKTTRRKKLEAEQHECSSALGRVDKELEELTRKIESETGRKGDQTLEERIDKIKSDIFNIQSTLNLLSESDEEEKREITALENEKSELEKKHGEITRHLSSLDKETEKKSSEEKNTSKELERFRDELKKLRAWEQKINEDIGSLQLKYAQRNAELTTLERSSGGLGKAINEILTLKSSIKGIHGTVSQLGKSTNKEYELPLQIAAGGRMFNLVVDDEEVAAKCIEHLRSKRIGRATFLPLNKISAETGKEKPDGVIGFAKDFITCDERFRKVFDYVFGDTLLVKDFKTAKAIGVGKWRMVTLDGDLMDRSGAMTGGYTQKVELVFSNIDEIKEELVAIEKQSEKLEDELGEVRSKSKKYEENLIRVESALTTQKTELEQIKLEKNLTSGKVSELHESIKAVETRISERNKKISENARKRAELQKKLENTKPEQDALLKKRKELKLDYVDELKDEERNKRIERSTFEERIRNLTQNFNDLTKELSELSEQKKTKELELKETEVRATTVKNELDSEEKEALSAVSQVKKLMEKRVELENKITEVSNRNGELGFEVEKINSSVQEKEIEKTRAETEAANLREGYKVFEQFELIPEKTLEELDALILKTEQDLNILGSVNLKAIETYEEMKKDTDSILEKLETLKAERQSIYDFMDSVEKRKHETFMKTFEVVNENFEHIFSELSGGKGTLTLDNPKDISESGLLIRASPGGKKIMSLDAMSGGEKVLTSAAFLLAIQRYKSAYFYVVDELDAALDSDNSDRLARILRDSGTQFILVTHNNSVLKHAQSAIGVTMVNGISQIVGVKLT